MLSKAQIKHISSLHSKKNRKEHAQFFVEGKKSIECLATSSYEVDELFFTSQYKTVANGLHFNKKTLISPEDLQKISVQKQPEGLFALVKMPLSPSIHKLENNKYIALDTIRDPGNLGTIIRLADWFGIKEVLCSEDCVELYNPKVIQASMGSMFHVNVQTVDLKEVIKKATIESYAATLDGQSIYEQKPCASAILIIGNEANGISSDVLKHCSHKVSIPAQGQAESLNAAMACGILCSYLFR